MKTPAIMEKVDDAVFQNLEKIKSQEQFQNFLETYNNWEDKTQELFRGVLLAIVIIIPVFITFLVYLANSTAHSNYETKLEILKYINKIHHQNSEIKNVSTKYLGEAVSSEASLGSQIKSSLPALNIDANKITISDFQSDEEDGLNRINAQVRFKDLTSQELLGLLRLLAITKKMRLEEIDIAKNQESNLLGGNMKIIHFSKTTIVEEE